MRDARFILALRRSHYLFDDIRPVLEDLRAEGGTEALRTAITTRSAALTARTAAMLEGAGICTRTCVRPPPSRPRRPGRPHSARRATSERHPARP